MSSVCSASRRQAIRVYLCSGSMLLRRSHAGTPALHAAGREGVYGCQDRPVRAAGHATAAAAGARLAAACRRSVSHDCVLSCEWRAWKHPSLQPEPVLLCLAVPYYGQYAHAASVFEGEALGRHKWNGAMATIHSPSSFSRIFKVF